MNPYPRTPLGTLQFARELLVGQRYDLQTVLNELMEDNSNAHQRRIVDIIDSLEDLDSRINQIEARIEQINNQPPPEEAPSPPENEEAPPSPENEDDLPGLIPDEVPEVNDEEHSDSESEENNGEDPLLALQRMMREMIQAQQNAQAEIQITSNQQSQLGALFIQAIAQNLLLPQLNSVATNMENALQELDNFLQSKVPVPLEQKYLDQMPEKLYSGEVHGTKCSVCLEEFTFQDYLRVLPCTHAYHPKCIDEWFKDKPTCPVCRVDVREELDKLSESDTASTSESSQVHSTDHT